MTWRSPKLLKACRELPCQMCGREDGTIVAAHSNSVADGKGRAIKAPDYCVASLCFKCHHDIDQGSGMNRLERRQAWLDAHVKTLRLLLEREIVRVV